jgi:O-antigen biosynthesis protein WbqP
VNLIRCLDYVLASIILICLAPLLIVVFLVLYLESGKPIFCQERVGKNGIPFIIIKFRTMRLSSPELATHEVDRKYITTIGSILRKSKVDELPQLLNVLKGEMSLVGPRPCLPYQTKVIELRSRQGLSAVKPGITGLAQIRGIDMADPVKLARVDAEMVNNLSLQLYLKILVGTVFKNGK